MTIEDVLSCEIPEGIYKIEMEIMRNSIPYLNKVLHRKRIDSLCAAFSALYDLATGKGGYSQAIKDVLEVIERNTHMDDLVTMRIYDCSVGDLIKRIKSLEAQNG